MKRGIKLLALLLIGLMALTLMPATAHADPPPSDPTHYHHWVVTYDRKPTCTLFGGRIWTCTACGRTYTETFPALGHDWDEGVITAEPSHFTPGEKTYTCKNDSSHTYTEEVDPAPWLFATISGVTFDPTDTKTRDLPPIVITEQPVGGAITRYEDESVSLHVTATGGVGELSYEWHSDTQEAFAEGDANAFAVWFLGLFGVTPEEVQAALQQSYSDTDTCVVSDGGVKYYCVVHDEAGQTATSDKAEVRYKIRIAIQPDNVNLQGADPVLSCKAADGSGDYTYRWYDSEMGILGEGQTLPATEPGICYCCCIVTDNVTGETATSEYCEVYSADLFRLAGMTGDMELLPGKTMQLTAAFTGGVEDYEIWWDKDGTAIDSEEHKNENDGLWYSHAVADGPGDYTVHGVDSMYATASASVRVSVPKLTIVEQPQGGNLPYKGGGLPLSIQVTGGKEPYHYELFRNGKSYISGSSSPLTAWKSGNYYFRVEDSEGRYCESNYVYVGDAVLHISAQSHAEELLRPGASLALYVEAEGGKLPYTYHWSVKKGSDWYNTGSNSQWQVVYAPGEYYCQVVDADNDFVFSDTMTVTYAGGAPWITEHPKNTQVPVVPEGQFFTTLSCKAISGTGDDSSLKYTWEVQYNGNWALLKDEGPSIQVEYTGLYRCRVADTATGEYSYSTAAYVYWPITCNYAQPWKSSSSTRYFYRASFLGGVGPYTVTTYRVVPDPKTGHLYNRVQDPGKTKVNTMSELYMMTFLEAKYLETMDWDEEAQAYTQLKAGCIVDVKDALGNSCQSPYMEWE